MESIKNTITSLTKLFVRCETGGLRSVPSLTVNRYCLTEFVSDFYDARQAEGFTDDDLNMMPVPEYVEFIKSWVDEYKAK